ARSGSAAPADRRRREDAGRVLQVHVVVVAVVEERARDVEDRGGPVEQRGPLYATRLDRHLEEAADLLVQLQGVRELGLRVDRVVHEREVEPLAAEDRRWADLGVRGRLLRVLGGGLRADGALAEAIDVGGERRERVEPARWKGLTGVGQRA